MTADEDPGWYGVRCVFRRSWPGDRAGQVAGVASYEERVTLWRAGSFDAAIALGEAEATEYAALLEDVTALAFVQAYALAEPPGHGAEVFSSIRDSALTPDDYLDQFFDTGRERQHTVD
ncbi:hypothetical protein [Modestobacter versicolor]|uniref:hypothetical protein n=1 Tax=Modestobacter versicolor TaxID=429133 RepID=UPI0034DF599E